MEKAKARADGLFEHYRAHHEMGRPLLQWMGVVGCVAFPLLYALRRATTEAGFDDLWLRLPAIALCFGLATRQWWPEKLKSHYLIYSWWVVFYCLSFFLSFTMLSNGGGTPFVVNMVMGAVLIVLLADWRNTVAILLLGWTSALSIHFGHGASPAIPPDFVFAVAGSLLLVTGGALSHKGQQRVELERMRRLYAGLAGSVAHEMRTPLAQIQHVLRCIEAEVSPDSEAARLVRQGQSAIQRGLQSITVTLRQISHRKPTPIELRPQSAGQCVRKAVEEYAYDSPEARECVHLRVEEDFHFQGDATTFELMLFNLLKNALYYLPVRPAMEIGVTVKTTPTTCIVVRDTGPGIPPEVLSRLFQEFQTHGKAEGTGLGLAFCHRTLQEWGGDIACRSEQGHFTEFTINLPSCPASAPAPSSAEVAPAIAEPQHSLTGRTVLIVDDQWFNRRVTRAVTAQFGMTALEAEHGQQALDMLQAGTVPDIVLMDMHMPVLDGMSTTRRLRALPGAAGRVPVLALTANDSADVHAEAREAGMQGVLGKPIDADALTAALLTSLSQTSSHSLRV